MAEAGGVLVARMSAMLTWEGQPVLVAEGRTTAREGHPILDEHGALFKPLEVDFEVTGKPAARPQSRSTQPPAKAAAAGAQDQAKG
jgi:hypothetical protein